MGTVLRSRWALWVGVGLVAAGIAAALIVVSVIGSSDSKSSIGLHASSTAATKPVRGPVRRAPIR